MVVLLLFLALPRIASLTNYKDRKVGKIVARHKIVSVRAEGYASQQSSTPENPESFTMRGNAPVVSSLGCEAAGLTTLSYSTCQGLSPCPSLQMVSQCWLFSFLILCEVSIHVFVHVRVQAKNSNGTTVRTFSNFNLLRGHDTWVR